MPKVEEGSRYPKKYTEQQLQSALKAIKDGVPLREAARHFNIPRATLQSRRSDKFTKISPGPPPVLTIKEEELLVKWVVENAQKGFPRRKEDLQLAVKSFLDKVPRKNPFKDNYPHEGWYKAFLRRHTTLSIRTPEAVTSASSNVSEKDIRKWFKDINTYLVSKGYDGILTDPARIFNGDETCFNLCPKNSRVLAPRGTSNVYEVEHAPSKQNITVMFTFSATGLTTPPMIIYPGKRLKAEIEATVPPEWGIGISDTGWMEAEVFQDYICNVLHPSLVKNNIEFPIILFVDGHSTHLTYELSDFCKELKIILICLYPNATRISQPADVAAFKPIKSGWKKAVLKWRTDNLNCILGKDKFAPILEGVVTEYAKRKTITNGFRATGLYPFDPDSIDFSKCLGGQNQEKENKNIDNRQPKPMSYETFQNIVGEEKIKLFKSFSAKTNKYSTDFILLFKVWKEFHAVRKESDNNTIEEEINEMDPTEYQGESQLTTAGNQLELEQNNILTIEPSGPTVPDHDDLFQGNIEEQKRFENNLELGINDRKINKGQENLDMGELETFSNTEELETIGTEGIEKGNDEEKNNLIENSDVDLFSREFSTVDLENIPIIFDDIPMQIESDIIIEEVHNMTNGKNNDIQNSMPVTLENVLKYAKTPQRKGTRNTERTPFVITGTNWRENKRKQEEEKLAKELEKEEKKKRRQEQESAKILKKTRIEENRKEKLEDKKLKLEIKSKKYTKKKSNKTNIAGIVSKRENTEVSKSMKRITKNLFQNESRPQSDQTHNQNTQPSILKNDNSINIISEDIFNPSEECSMKNLIKDIGLSEELNIKISIGLCYICTNNLSLINFGIKCQGCARSYHIRCMKKHNVHQSNSAIFHCETCLKKH